jgi:hypothetical protein
VEQALIETLAPGYLEAAIALIGATANQRRGTLLPFHRALVDFEMLKLELAMARTPADSNAAAKRLENRQLAHTPLILASDTRLQAFDYAVHSRSPESGTRSPCPTRLLIYRSENKTVKHQELEAANYAMLLAIKLASDEQCGLAATELLVELADYYDTNNVMQFVEQGLKLLGRLNDLGLILGTAVLCGREAWANKS